MTAFDDAPAPVAEYYRLLTSGVEEYGDGSAMAALLDPDLSFQGPLSGHMRGAARFVTSLTRFVESVRSIDPSRLVVGDAQVATHYIAAMPGGAVRFSEFFTLRDGLITEIHVHYDAADYVAKGGR